MPDAAATPSLLCPSLTRAWHRVVRVGVVASGGSQSDIPSIAAAVRHAATLCA
jgi:hypothetical protein